MIGYKQSMTGAWLGGAVERLGNAEAPFSTAGISFLRVVTRRRLAVGPHARNSRRSLHGYRPLGDAGSRSQLHRRASGSTCKFISDRPASVSRRANPSLTARPY